MNLNHIETVSDCLSQASQFERDGQPQQAVSLYNRAIEIDPRNIDARQALGTLYLTQKSYDLALGS